MKNILLSLLIVQTFSHSKIFECTLFDIGVDSKDPKYIYGDVKIYFNAEPKKLIIYTILSKEDTILIDKIKGEDKKTDISIYTSKEENHPLVYAVYNSFKGEIRIIGEYIIINGRDCHKIKM